MDSASVDANAENPATGGATNAATTERVVVTGSYIPTAETESALPVTVYTSTVLQKQGANTPVEGLRQLPSFVGNASTENDSNGGNGAAFINLRAIGQENTLVLINGRRAFATSNVNTIPIGALSRSEILKEGASAVYGSDAVAGVVNFILLNGPGEAPYEGAEVDFLYGNTTDTDARVLQTYIRGGVATDKVSIAAAAQYYDRDALFSRDREISATADRRFLGGNQGGSPTYAGRANIRPDNGGVPFLPTGAAAFEDTFTRIDLSSTALTGNPITREGNATYRVFDPPSGPTGGGTDPDRFNFRAFTPAIPPIEIKNLYASGRYKIFGEALQVYGDVFFASSKQDNGLAPAPFALNTFEANASPFNPFNNPVADQVVQPGVLNGDPTPNNDINPFKAGVQKGNETTIDNQLRGLSYRLVQELGNRRSLYDFDYDRYVVGFNGNFDIKDNQFISNFGYDTGLVYETTDQIRTDSGDAKRSVITDAIANGVDLDGDGTITYFNPFIGQNAPTSGVAPTYQIAADPALVVLPGATLTGNGTTTNGVQTGTAAFDNSRIVNELAAFTARTLSPERHYLIDAKIFGNLFPGLYQGGVGFNIGYEHRNSEFEQFPDPTQEAGDQLGFNAGARYNFRTEVDSYFGELRVPLITSAMNIPFAKSLEASFAFRYEEFENTDLFNKDAARRSSTTVATLASACATSRSRTSRSRFLRNIVPVAERVPVVQSASAELPAAVRHLLEPDAAAGGGVFQGGTQGLQPETTDSYSAGIVVTPRFLPGFTMTGRLVSGLYQEPDRQRGSDCSATAYA
jgi:outer membrane receptor protein involved in Fe transport